MINKINTGENLRHIRKNYLKLSKKKLADKLKISEKTVYNWENKELVKMANWLSVCSLIEHDKPLSIEYNCYRKKHEELSRKNN